MGTIVQRDLLAKRWPFIVVLVGSEVINRQNECPHVVNFWADIGTQNMIIATNWDCISCMILQRVVQIFLTSA